MTPRAARTVTTLIGIAGLGGLAFILANQDLDALAGLFVAAGWGLVLGMLSHIPPMIASALGWYAVAAPLRRLGWPLFFWARLVRETVSGILPLTQIGGDVAGARVLTIHGARGVDASASVLADMTLEFLTQIAFTLMGLALLLMINADGTVVRWTLIGLAVAVPSALAFLLAQRWGLFRALERMLESLALRFGWKDLQGLSGLHESLSALYRNRRGVAGGAFWHLVSWLAGAGELWIILWVLGFKIGVAEALVIESLVQAIRSAAFFVPGAIGVQEGGFLLLGVLFGLPPEAGLSVSLVKRMREIVIGVPALLIWQGFEGRKAMATAREKA